MTEIHQEDDPIHNWFGLSYASYLTIPRSVLQSMPVDWQRRMVKLLEEMAKECEKHQIELPSTIVNRRGKKGTYIMDDLAKYDRGRRRLW